MMDYIKKNIQSIVVGAIFVSVVIGQLLRVSPFPNSGAALISVDIVIAAVFVGFIANMLFKNKWGDVSNLIENSVLWKILLAFFVWSLLSLLSNYGEYTHKQLLMAMVYWARLFSIFAVVYFLAISGFLKDRSRTVAIFIWSSVVIVVAGYLQLIIMPNFATMAVKFGWDPHVGRMLSTFFDPNYFGVYLTLIMSIVLSQVMSNTGKRRVWLAVFFFVTWLALYLTFSRSAWATGAIALTICAWRYSRKLSIGMLIVFILIALIPGRLSSRFQLSSSVFDSNNSNISETSIGVEGLEGSGGDLSAAARLLSVKKGLNLAKDNWIVGVGYNAYGYAMVNAGLYNKDYLKSHAANGSDSSLVNILATTGVIGLLLFLMILILMLCKLYLSSKYGSGTNIAPALFGFFIAWVAGSFINNTLLYTLILFPVLILIFSTEETSPPPKAEQIKILFGSIYDKLKTNIYSIVFFVILSYHVVINFYGQLKYHYIMAPGGDMMVHLSLINSMLSDYRSAFEQGYPPLYHILIAMVVKITGYSSMVVTAYSVPVLLVSSGLAVYWLASKIFNRSVGIMAYFFYALVSTQPSQTAFDGGLPNILGGHMILPLMMILFIGMWSSIGRRFYFELLGFVILLITLAITHHLSTLIALAVIIPVLPFLFWWRCRAVFHKGLAMTISSTVLWGIVGYLVFYVFSKFGLFRYADNLALNFVSYNNQFPFLHISNSYQGSPVPLIGDYASSLSSIVFYGSIIGALLLIIQNCYKRSTKPSIIVVVFWFMVVFVGSRMPWLGEPGRLVRDLSIPSSVIVGLLFVEFYNLSCLMPLKVILIFIFTIICALMVSDKSINIIKYNRMVYLSEADLKLYSTIKGYGCNEPYYVSDKSGFWKFLAKDEIDKGSIALEDDIVGDDRSLSTGKCLFVSNYKAGVWPAWFNDYDRIVSVEDLAGGTVRPILEDNQKIWYLLIKK